MTDDSRGDDGDGATDDVRRGDEPTDAVRSDDEPSGNDEVSDVGSRVSDGAGPVGGGPDEVRAHRETPGGALLGGLVNRQLVVKTLVGFGVAAVLIYLLGWATGWERIFEALSGARLRWLAVACASTLVGLAAWGKAWQVVLSVVGVRESYRRLVVTYFAATFANYVTPLGQAGGEPFIAYVLSTDTDASYEDSLASVVTADLLNLLPFFNFAALGLAWLLVKASLPENAETLAQGLVIMALGVPGLVYVGWRHRDAVEAAVLRIVEPLTRHTTRITLDGTRRRIEEFYAALERIADEPRALVYALVFAYVGWVFFALPLYFGGLTLGYDLDVLLILFIVPASTLAGLVPTPGGSGAVEGALTVLLIALAGLTEPQAFALAIVYRLASFYFSILVGGVAALWVIART